MNPDLVKASKWLNDLGIETKAQSSQSLFVSKEGVSSLGNPKEVLAAVNEGIGSRRLFWNDVNETVAWYVLETF